jgi:hypothetical protein
VKSIFDAYYEDAIAGNDIFYSRFSEGVFSSCAFTPIISKAATMGLVFIYESDEAQGGFSWACRHAEKHLHCGHCSFRAAGDFCAAADHEADHYHPGCYHLRAGGRIQLPDPGQRQR